MNLNELLEKRAEKKLEADIETYLQTIRENKLFAGISDKQIRVEDGYSETIHYFVWSNSTAQKMIKEKFLKEYITRESEAFMEKVDLLQDEINNLKNE